jgi:predicted RNA-binding protein with PIN domain
VEKPRHLFVDGHNILHAWSWLQGTIDATAMAVARERLVEAVRAIHDVERIAVTVVFDGRGASAASSDVRSADDVAVIYAPSHLTADSVIERAVAGSADPAACIVGTADHLERETVLAAGAECVSPAELQAWVGRCHARVTARAKATRKQDFGNKLPL